MKKLSKICKFEISKSELQKDCTGENIYEVARQDINIYNIAAKKIMKYIFLCKCA